MGRFPDAAGAGHFFGAGSSPGSSQTDCVAQALAVGKESRNHSAFLTSNLRGLVTSDPRQPTLHLRVRRPTEPPRSNRSHCRGYRSSATVVARRSAEACPGCVWRSSYDTGARQLRARAGGTRWFLLPPRRRSRATMSGWREFLALRAPSPSAPVRPLSTARSTISGKKRK